ncbi:hypothetical protein BXZ70DRAFT_466931 [Cristinia sonorae]|uniref:Uncharacterized protein n=1 Tax=Cristinia sonorae TaxID=1940300 RepID=A0A8K0UH87_9AGAR|nr:hypothetical protein BXZ70DRAFT_466931 [Cristinia sonorae]
MQDEAETATGIRTLFLPERLYSSSDRSIPSAGFPTELSAIHALPFDPWFDFRQRQPSLHCRPMHCAPLRTVDGSHTKPPLSVENLASHHQLRYIKQSLRLWNNVKSYTETDTQINTWNLAETLQVRERSVVELPSASQQADAIESLRGWSILQAKHAPPIVESEMSIQLEVHAQLLQPIDILLRTRYRNTVGNKLNDATIDRNNSGWTQPQKGLALLSPPNSTAGLITSTPLPSQSREQVKPYSQGITSSTVGTEDPSHDSEGFIMDDLFVSGDKDNLEGLSLGDGAFGQVLSANGSQSSDQSDSSPLHPDAQNPPLASFFPKWGQAVAAAHLSGKSLVSLAKAGFPDRMLRKDANLFSHGAICELKVFWGVTDHELAMIFSKSSAEYGTGMFRWDCDERQRTPLHDLLKQLWGQLHFFRTKWGFLTNGSKVLLFLKTDEQELTFSDLHDWSDPDVLQAVLGVCFASLDHDYGATSETALIGHLCPAGDRSADWTIAVMAPWNFSSSNHNDTVSTHETWSNDGTFEPSREHSELPPRDQPL